MTEANKRTEPLTPEDRPMPTDELLKRRLAHQMREAAEMEARRQNSGTGGPEKR